jgi:hypothetical protein
MLSNTLFGDISCDAVKVEDSIFHKIGLETIKNDLLSDKSISYKCTLQLLLQSIEAFKVLYSKKIEFSDPVIVSEESQIAFSHCVVNDNNVYIIPVNLFDYDIVYIPQYLLEKDHKLPTYYVFVITDDEADEGEPNCVIIGYITHNNSLQKGVASVITDMDDPKAKSFSIQRIAPNFGKLLAQM